MQSFPPTLRPDVCMIFSVSSCSLLSLAPSFSHICVAVSHVSQPSSSSSSRPSHRADCCSMKGRGHVVTSSDATKRGTRQSERLHCSSRVTVELSLHLSGDDHQFPLESRGLKMMTPVRLSIQHRDMTFGWDSHGPQTMIHRYFGDFGILKTNH